MSGQLGARYKKCKGQKIMNDNAWGGGGGRKIKSVCLNSLALEKAAQNTQQRNNHHGKMS